MDQSVFCRLIITMYTINLIAYLVIKYTYTPTVTSVVVTKYPS